MNRSTTTRRSQGARLLAASALLAAAGAAQAQTSYSFQSPALDNTGFTATLMLAAPFADGNWSMTGATAPAGIAYSVSDGYTTDASLADLSALSFTSLAGVLSNISLTVVDQASTFDPYYGYTSFFAGSGSTQLQDALNPGIVGLDYAGHHIPVANGGPGVWTRVETAPAVPEPSTGALLALGLGFAGFAARRAAPRKTA